MKRVLIVAFGFPPTSSAGVFRTLRYTKYLRDFGWEPLILTVDSDATRREFDESLAERLPEDLVVCRTGIPAPDEALKGWMRLGTRKPSDARPSQTEPLTTPSRGTGWTRNLWDLIFSTPDERIWWKSPAVKAARAMVERHEPSVIYSTGPPHSTHLIAAQISRAAGLPLVADFRDPWARAPWRAERNPWGAKLHAVYERRLVSAASQIILNTSRLADDFKQTYPEHREKFTVITNGFDPDLLSVASRLRETSEAPDHYTLCHPGSLYGRRDPRPLLEAIRRLARDGSRILLQQIGSHDRRFELDRWAKSSDIASLLTVLPHVPHAEVLRRMASASCLVLIQPGTHLQVPGKLFEMLMFRKPILALSDPGATTDIIEDYDLGDIVSPGDTNAIEEALRGLAAKNDSPWSTQWHRVLSDFDGRRLTSRLAECLSRAV